jgi:hypothetical protein
MASDAGVFEKKALPLPAKEASSGAARVVNARPLHPLSDWKI